MFDNGKPYSIAEITIGTFLVSVLLLSVVETVVRFIWFFQALNR